MRTLHINALSSELGAHLHSIQGGEEILVHDNDGPVARILPYRPDSSEQPTTPLDFSTDQEADLAARGPLKMPDWDAFFALPVGNVDREVALEALRWSRGKW